MAAGEGVIAGVDSIIALFNARKMDLPDNFFDRKTQFVINGAAFETLLGRSPDDPLILMLARGPAGFRFAAKALQHAIPDVTIERGEIEGGDPSTMTAGDLAEGKPVTIGAEDDIEEALETMKRHQIRRLPVIDGHDLVGIISQADIALAMAPEDTGETVAEISE